MQNSAWIDLIRRIPPQHHEVIGIITTAGTQLNLQAVLRIEESFMVCRARLAGHTEAGLTFFIPFDQIDSFYIQRIIKEPEVLGWFGGTLPVFAQQESTPAPAAGADGMPASAPGAPPAPAAAATGVTTQIGAAPLPGKAAILDRLRKRTSGGGSAHGTVPKPPVNPPDK